MGVFDRLFGKGSEEEHKRAEGLHRFALQQAANPEQALEYLTKAVKIDPKAVGIWLDRGNVLHLLKRHDEAMRCYEKVLEIDQGYGMAWTNKGNLLLELGRHEEARRCYDRALEIDPGDEKARTGKRDAWYNQGNDALRARRFEHATECYDRALEIDSMSCEAWANKAAALGGLGRHGEAIGCYDAALQIDPNDRVAREGRKTAESLLQEEERGGRTKAESSEEQRKAIYLDFVQAEKDEREGPPIDDILRDVRVRPGQSPADAIARAVVSRRMVDEQTSYDRALDKVAAKYHLTKGELKSIIEQFTSRQP